MFRSSTHRVVRPLGNATDSINQSPTDFLVRFSWLALIALICWGSPARAQTAEFTQNNKSNNAMTMQVPLGNYPGRGVSLPVNLNYSTQGLWRIGFINSVYVNVWGFQIRRSVAEAIYAEHSTAGWTVSLNVPEVEWPKQSDVFYATGRPYASGWINGYTYRIARVLIHMPDGSTHELRRSDQIYSNPQVEMNGTFYAVDGSRMRYDGNSDGTGTLYMSDGSRYVLNGGATQFIDRNGNTLSYNATNRQWTDTMGRVIGMPWPVNPAGGDYPYSLPGLNGTAITYILKFRNLSTVLTPGSPAPKPMSDYYLPTPFSPPTNQGTSNFPQPTGAATMFTSDYSEPDSEASYTYVVGRGQSGAANFDPVVLAEIDLPNGQSYRFSYNPFGELDKVIYPTGGYQRYQYGNVPALTGAAVVPYGQGTRGITSRWVSPSGGGGDEAHWTYSNLGCASDPGPLTVIAPNGVCSETYLFSPSSSQSNNFGYDDARTGSPKEERVYASQGGAMLRRTLIDYEQSSASFSKLYPGTGSYTAYRNPRPIKTVSLILDTGGNALASTSTTGYDATYQFTVGPEPTSSSQYDYASVDQTTAQTGAIGSIPIGALVHSSQTTYLTSDPNYRGRNILGLPNWSAVYNGVGAMVALSTVSYDESGYPLYNYGAITGWTDPGTTIRGNATTASKWFDVGSTWLSAHTQYDQAGSPINSWDPKGNLSQVGYSSAYAYAYPTLTISPVPDPTGAYGSTTSLTATNVYDFYTGLVASATDANGKTTTFEYNDPLNRVTRVNQPDGGYTRKIYVDAHQCGPYVETRTLLDSSGRETDAYQFVDGLGRVYRAFSYENQDPSNPYLTVDTQYDSMGRAWRGSSPYRSSGCTATVNPTGRWIQTTFDALSRPTSVLTTADNATVTTSYSGNIVTVTDPAGKTRRSVSDALGRLTAIYEDPNGVNYLTSYNYDALGNLRTVNQGGQQRFFMYDSLGRLLRAKYPEQDANGALNVSDPVSGNSAWSMAYNYDNDSNLTSRTDARNVTTSYGYDALNRGITVRYTDGTKDIDRHYDGAVNGRGRFHYSNWDASNNTRFDTHVAIDEYDALGRPKNYRQHFLINGVATPQFNVKRTYDYAGDVLTQTYPSGHTVNYSYDIAGRINNYSGTLGDGVSRTYSTGLSFSEFGGLQQEQFGTQTPLYHKLHYNSRGQLYDIRLSSYSLQANEFDWNRGCLEFFYGGAAWGQSSAANNGNMTSQMHYIPADYVYSNYGYTQDTYNYDSLNRLSSTNEIHGGPGWVSGQDYAQVYNYDRWGNRTVDQNQTTANVPRPNYTVDTNTNRLIAPSGSNYSYDAAGNQTNDSYTGEGTRTYDAENRMKQAQGSPNSQWQTYTYDADGRRIKRVVNGTETWQLYGMGGELLAEYKSGAAAFLPTKEYGYRGGELLVTMASGDDARLARFVTSLYYGALQRDPTSTELQNGINQLAAAGAQGQSQLLTAASQLARSLFTSTNYENPGRSDIQYVGDLYYAYLQRGPDDSGLNWWTGQASGNRANVCNAFEASGEFVTLVSTLYGTATSDNQRTEQFVNNFYLGAYGRNATSTELQTQRDALNVAAAQGLAQVQAQAESFGRSLFVAQVADINSNSDEQFVTNLYESFLQRGPDAGGLNFWKGQAAGSSTNRQNVLNAFAGCGSAHELAGTLYREAYWLVNDRLGTPRMIVDKSGSLASVRRHDYLPFGEEIYAGTGGRTTAQGYTGDSARQKFTGYEMDAETGLNFAQARYQSSVQGRFTSVDPLPASATVTDPQSLNRYSYVQNNPTNFTDPTGMMLSDIGVFQTNDPEEAATTQRKRDSDFKRAINGDYARSHGGTASYDKDGHATFIGKGSAVNYFRRMLARGSVSVSATITGVAGNPQDPGVTATVNFWAPYDNGVGHMSVGYSNGVYVSFWPQRYPGKLGIAFWDGDEPGLLQYDLDTDIRSEDNHRPTEQYVVTGLDGAAVSYFFSQVEKGPGRWSIGRNCADLVAQSLQAGGLLIENTQPGSSTPRDVLNLIKAAASLPRFNTEKITWQGKPRPRRYPQ